MDRPFSASSPDLKKEAMKHTVGFCDHVHLGNFSLDENRNYCDDHRNRRYFVKPDPRPHFDLLEGHAAFVDRYHPSSSPVPSDDVESEVKSLDVVLKWIRDHSGELEKRGFITTSSGEKRLSVDFITRRGALHDLMKSAHLNSRFEFLATRFRGTCYLEQIDLQNHEHQNDPHRIRVYSGKKFAQYCSSEDGSKPDTSLPINDNLAYEAVMAARCGDFRLMFSVEIHAEERDRGRIPLPFRRSQHLKYVNIRTTCEFNGLTDIQQSKAFFRKKLFQFWSQNHIAGIPRVLLGWRDDAQHVITRAETYKTDDIPDIDLCPWKPHRYFTAVTNLLLEIMRIVSIDNPRLVICIWLVCVCVRIFLIHALFPAFTLNSYVDSITYTSRQMLQFTLRNFKRFCYYTLSCVVYHLILEEVPRVGLPWSELAKRLEERRFEVRRKEGYKIVPDWFARDVVPGNYGNG
ncbi:decapping and exoribonuclease protein-like [Diadema antillarum]|uniref:decapping and exoribonuclease protein-like n=1 Tax=Diadema antillarum TaxID=105358 RepID=UPI003A862935